MLTLKEIDQQIAETNKLLQQTIVGSYWNIEKINKLERYKVILNKFNSDHTQIVKYLGNLLDNYRVRLFQEIVDIIHLLEIE